MRADALPRTIPVGRWHWAIAVAQPVLGVCWLTVGLSSGSGSGFRIGFGIILLVLGSAGLFLLPPG